MAKIPEKAQFALIGIIFHPGHEKPWTVQDNRKATRNEYHCQTKGDVLEKIAEILDEMDHSQTRSHHARH